jgi:exopolyphosphatase/guanosine-5'-triphosphate,3'-diphosphate pyrophosphatase
LKRVAVIDLGSNSFRLVVFTREDSGAWKRTDEIYEPVRIGEGQGGHGGELQPEPVERALETLELFEHFCRHMRIDDVRPVATSAIREATNRKAFLAQARKRSGLEVRVLSREEEAFFGYVAAVNTTRLVDGVALDIGGGSMQLTRVRKRVAKDSRSWPLGAVRVTERFLSDKENAKAVKALRAHVAEELASAEWLAGAGKSGRLAGIGGTVRNLAAAAMAAAGLPSPNVQGFELTRRMLGELVSTLADLDPAGRGKVPGIKPERGDIILAGALVVEAVLEAGGFEAIEVSEAGLREGVFFSTLLDGDPPLVDDVRRAAVRNLAAQYDTDFAHVEHVATLALAVWDALAEQGVHAGDPDERELLHAAALLHDIGVAVDYDDHHKHSRYLILNAGLPGHSPRETALIAQMARYHRKGVPSLADLAPLAHRGDDALLRRGAALLRLAEQLDRARDQLVRDVRVNVRDGSVRLALKADGDASLALWSGGRQVDIFEKAFGKKLELRAA